MKENLNVQFIYPNYQLPQEHRDVIETVDHTKIGPIGCCEELDMIVVKRLQEIAGRIEKPCIWQCSLKELCEQKEKVKLFMQKVPRLNIMLTDIPEWKQMEFYAYKAVLEDLVKWCVDDTLVSAQGDKTILPQLNLLTDRLLLREMNNCGAGDSCITLAPDGKFYICPAYYPGLEVGSLDTGLVIPNKQLMQLDHAPICRKCDAYQCKRCVWWNEQLTMDVNTPSHEQCVASHLERNASRKLQQMLQEKGIILENSFEIKEIDYLDPINFVSRWKQERSWEQ